MPMWKYQKASEPKWYPYFAWKPVFIGSLPPVEGQTVVWLKWVERRKLLTDAMFVQGYEYRLRKETLKKSFV
jgi:hypothetical protein